MLPEKYNSKRIFPEKLPTQQKNQKLQGTGANEVWTRNPEPTVQTA